MKCALLLLAAALPLFSEESWALEERQDIAKTLDVSNSGTSSPKLLADVISGYIHVTGYRGTSVRISATLRFRARSAEAMAEAKRDVKLDINQQGNFARVYLDGPFRHQNHRGEHYYGYQVSADLDIEVPLGAETELSTVNGGAIILKNTAGDFRLSNVNGSISLEACSGSGSVSTVNGPLSARFQTNPARMSSFRSVNGSIDLFVKKPLNADLRFSTVNGQVFTDFNLAPLGPLQSKTELAQGKFVYRSNRGQSGRAGTGGPEVSFSTVNGNVRIHGL